MKRFWILAVAALAGCRQSAAGEANAASATAPLGVRSSVADVRIVATRQLPPNPKRRRVEEYCSSYAVDRPRTAGGRLAARNGWIVTSETKLGRFDAVTFVGSLEPATSATCLHVDGNLALFEGPALRALAYQRRHHGGTTGGSASGTGAEVEDSLGSAEQVDAHRIRLYYGLPGGPFADVVLGDGVAVEPVARQDSVCGGAAIVPNVFGEGIGEARKRLIARGWTEQAGAEAAAGSAAGEAESCSGTGYAFCGFDYRHPKGFGLSVTTTGEERRVSSVAVQCTPPSTPRPRR